MARSRYTKDEAKKIILEGITQGLSVEDACRKAERARKTYENERLRDREWAKAIDEARERRRKAVETGASAEAANLSFEEWRLRYMGNETYRHQRTWIDLLEGRGYTPYPGEQYTEGRPNRLLVNTPPFHAKTTTITVEYITYRICRNPNIRVIIVSKTQKQAQKFLYGIKQRLTSPAYAELQAAYAPDGGFRGEGLDKATWNANMIYVSGRLRDSGEKDPTVEALGMGGHIYGARADLIVLDDCVVLSNAAEHEKQREWLTQEVASRAKTGKILVVGTRVSPVDLYSELMNTDNYPLTGKSPWTHLAQPAVLEFAEDPKDWKTLWPRSSRALDEDSEQEPDENGTYAAWDGPALNDVRNEISPSKWALVYMQMAVSEDSTFHPACVKGSIQGNRKIGRLVPGAWGHPRRGQEGMYVIGSIDPAATGKAFAHVQAVDRQTHMRYVLDAWTKANTPIRWYVDLIKEQTDVYGVNEWVIESQAYSTWLIHDPELTRWAASRGVRITPHYTSRNKQDPDFGVASMAPLFGTVKRLHDGAGREVFQGDNLIELPNPDGNEALKSLVEQLITWQPGKLGRQLEQDGVMSLWFAEIRTRELLTGGARQQTHLTNKYASRKALSRRVVVSLDEYQDATA